MNELLQRYWLQVSGNKYFPNIGVTAFSEDSVTNILRDKIGGSLSIEFITAINSIAELDQNHVVPNMEEFISRGIGYPKGFRTMHKSVYRKFHAFKDLKYLKSDQKDIFCVG